MLPEVLSARQRLEETIALANNLQADAVLLSHWSKYICVLTSGHIESSLTVILSHYVQLNGNQRVQQFSTKHLRAFQNPKPGKINDLLECFDEDWASQLEAFWAGERRDSIASVVNNRHIISHGGETGITFHRMSDWYARTKEVITFIHTLVLPGV